MKTQIETQSHVGRFTCARSAIRALAALAVLSTLNAQLSTLLAQGTAFTYQGRFTDNGAAANGTYDLRFTIYDSTNLPGAVVAGPLTNAATSVASGLFTAKLDFGAGVFTGPDRWLEIAARSNGAAAFTILAPRQPLTASPYAVYAGGASAAGLTGTIPASSLGGTYSSALTFNNGANSFSGTFYGQFLGLSFIGGSFSGAFIGDGSGLANVNAATFGGITANQIWKTVGNTNTVPGVNFLGTADNQPLELRANNHTGWRLLPSSDVPNVVGGSLSNSVAPGVVAATIAGGGLDPFPNVINASFATIGGGTFNTASGAWSTIGGGRDNDAFADHSTVGGGRFNTTQTNADYATISGGYQNLAQSNADFAVIGGGYFNTAQSNSTYATIGGGDFNTIYTNVANATISGGYNNSVIASASVIGGGEANLVQKGADHSFIGGGLNNLILTSAAGSVIGGGQLNVVRAAFATVGGGSGNSILADAGNSTIGGGSQNIIQTNVSSSYIGGGYGNVIQANSAGFIIASTIAGGFLNLIQSNVTYAAISGGYQNTNGGPAALIGAGTFNRVLSPNSAIIGGVYNSIQTNSGNTFLGAGYNNLIQDGADDSSIVGGFQNLIQSGAAYSIIGGGVHNTNVGAYATIPGGQNNVATLNSFAAGSYAKAIHNGTFVWADASSATPFTSLFPEEFAVRASGGVRFVTGGLGVTVDGQSVIAGTVPGASLSGTYNNPVNFNNGGNSFTGNGGGLTNVNAAFFGGLVASNFWQLGGNNISPGQFLGSANGFPLEFRVGGAGRVMRFEQDGSGTASHVIGGSHSNGVPSYISGIFAATVGGGGSDAAPNLVTDDFATIAGGAGNIAGNTNNAFDRTAPAVGGGQFNTASGSFATIPGGFRNLASGDYSFAAGYFAQATNAGSFVWCDANGLVMNSTNVNSVTMRATGGYRLYSSTTVGVYLAPGSGSWTTISDRNAKENFQPVDSREVLEQVAQMPIQTWNYKSQDPAIRHLGPMAQDFNAAFHVGDAPNGITTVDEGGVALAAIQGLNRKLEDRNAEIVELKRRNDSLEKKLNALESAVRSLAKSN